MRNANLIVCALTSLLILNTGFAEMRAYPGGISEWRVNISRIGCNLSYYIWDHPHEVREHRLNLLFSFQFIVSDELGRLRYAAPLPMRETIFTIHSETSLSEAPNDPLQLIVDGENLEPDRVASNTDQTSTVVYFGAVKADAIRQALTTGRTVAIKSISEDDQEQFRLIGSTSFSVTDKIYKACASNIRDDSDLPRALKIGFWDAQGGEEGCQLSYWQNDHPRGYTEERSLRMDLHIMYLSSDEVISRSVSGLIPKHETFLVVSMKNPLVHPRIRKLGFVINGVYVEAARAEVREEYQDFFFSPQDTKQLAAALASNTFVAIDYEFEDGVTNKNNWIESEKQVDGTSFQLGEAMYNACVDAL